MLGTLQMSRQLKIQIDRCRVRVVVEINLLPQADTHEIWCSNTCLEAPPVLLSSCTTGKYPFGKETVVHVITRDFKQERLWRNLCAVMVILLLTNSLMLFYFYLFAMVNDYPLSLLFPLKDPQIPTGGHLTPNRLRSTVVC